MTIVANLDAAIEEHYATLDNVSRGILIFGREWELIRELTTVTLDPLAKIQAAAQIANSDNASFEDQMLALQMLAQINEILAMIIVEEEREAFRKIVNVKGIPVPIIGNVIEAVFSAFDAAPLASVASVASSTPPTTATPPLASTTASGSSPVTPGFTSSPSFDPQQPTTPVPAPVAPVAAVPPLT